jgi:hypothetical protein
VYQQSDGAPGSSQGNASAGSTELRQTLPGTNFEPPLAQRLSHQ